jgi:hypothetical protein
MSFILVSEMTELVFCMSAPQFGKDLRECEVKNWFRVQAVPLFCFD